jgi:hypothetical protein
MILGKTNILPTSTHCGIMSYPLLYLWILISSQHWTRTKEFDILNFRYYIGYVLRYVYPIPK